MAQRTITAAPTDVVLIISIEDARWLQGAIEEAGHFGLTDKRGIGAYVTLVTEQTVRGAAQSVDDILPNLVDPWANGAETSRERSVSPTGGTITDIVR